MSFILIGQTFFRSIAEGWLMYYENSSGPKFTEEQIRIADHTANILENCHPIKDFVGSRTHFGICESLRKSKFLQASKHLEK